jgi:hypothetical protein
MLNKLTLIFKKKTPKKQEELIYTNVIDACNLFFAVQANMHTWRILNQCLDLQSKNTIEDNTKADILRDFIGYNEALSKEYLNAINPRLEVFKEKFSESFRRGFACKHNATIIDFPIHINEEIIQ